MKFMALISKWTCYVGATIMGGVALLIFVDVFLRYAFNKPMEAGFHVVVLGFLAMIFLGVAWVQVSRRHMSMTFLSDRIGGKAGKLLRMATDLLVSIFFFALMWHSIREFISAYRNKSVDPGLLQIPVVFPTFFMAFGSLLIIGACLASITNDARELITGITSKEEKRIPSEDTTVT